MSSDPKVSVEFSSVTLKCLDLVVDTLEVLYDCLDNQGLRDQFGSLVDQARDQALPAEDRTYRIVRVLPEQEKQ